MTAALRRIATAAGVTSLLLEWASDCLSHLDDLICEFVQDEKVPDCVPDAWTVTE